MRLRMWAVLFGFFFVLPQAMAADGSSGCGPAWYILKDNSLISSFGRTITNGFLAPVVTFGMTSGTSNCTKHSIVLQEQERSYFVSSHFDELKSDVAQGQGPYLSQLTKFFGCEAGVQDVVARRLQQNYRTIYGAQAQSDAVIQRVQQLLQNEQRCRV